ncbi:MAG: DUF4180 domain-containing protein [Christensenellales bacterium]|jgi:hypothetical protein
MELRYVTAGSATAAVLEDGFIATVQDALDLIATASYQGASGVVIPMERLSRDFFSLKTGFAGEMLQKFVNYGMRAAIVGDFSGFKSDSLKAFIRESNRSGHVLFTPSVEEAVSELTRRG